MNAACRIDRLPPPAGWSVATGPPPSDRTTRIVALHRAVRVTQDAPMKLPGESTILVAIGFAFLVPTLVAIGAGIAFGYDEAVYAQLTRHWLTGAPADGWDLHRPPGLSVLGLVPQAVGLDGEWSHRLVGAVAGVGVVVAGWWMARTAGGATAGLVAAVALGASAPLQVESASFLTDVPSTLVLLILAVLLWRQLRATAIGASFVWLGVLAAAAFYLRYGAIVELVGLAVAAAIVAPARLLDGWRWVVAAVAAFVIALIPHIVIAVAETGTPWGILRLASSAASGGDGLPLLSYAAWFPWVLIGPLGAAIALLGVVAAIWRWSASPFARFIGVAALVPILVLGTLVHAEPRYCPLPDGPARRARLGGGRTSPRAPVTRARPGRGTRRLAVGCLVLAAAATLMEIRYRADTFDWKREAGRDIGTVAGPVEAPDCSIRTADVPIMSWYSGCRAVNFVGGEAGMAPQTGTHRFVVVRADGHLQPSPESVTEMLSGAEVWKTYLDARGQPAAVVYRLPDQ